MVCLWLFRQFGEKCFQKNKNIHIRNIQVVCILSRGQTKPEQCCLVSDINAAGPMTATLISQNITRKKITNKCTKGKWRTSIQWVNSKVGDVTWSIRSKHDCLHFDVWMEHTSSTRCGLSQTASQGEQVLGMRDEENNRTLKKSREKKSQFTLQC